VKAARWAGEVRDRDDGVVQTIACGGRRLALAREKSLLVPAEGGG